MKTLVDIDPDVFLNGELGDSQRKLRTAYQEADHRLAHPQLSIATIGTTSSGKSTLVNAITGRWLAPMETGEMSAGVVRLLHASENRLVIKPTVGADWPCGTWPEEPGGQITDEEIYKILGAKEERDGVSGVMEKYHKARDAGKSVASPLVEIEAPLLPAGWPDLLAIPEGVGFEILDLPGVNSVLDEGNYELVREKVPRSFCIVVLDYMHTDKKNLQKLLGEMKEVVDYTQGRTTAMLFVLNRVDLRKSTDDPLEMRVNMLKREIQKTLNLSVEPGIQPLIALLLCYVQCALGSAHPHSLPNAPPGVRSRVLNWLPADCAQSIHPIEKDNPDFDPTNEKFRDWFNRNKYSFSGIPHPELFHFWKLVFRQSRGGELWDQLRLRVQESFAELVIAPAVRGLLIAVTDYTTKANALINTRLMTTEAAIKEAMRILKEVEDKLQSYINGQKDNLEGRVETALGKLQQKSMSVADMNAAQTALGEGFRPVFGAVDAVRLDLSEQIIRPVREALRERGTAIQLASTLAKVLPPPRDDELAHAYEMYKDAITPEEAHKGGSRRVKAGDSQGERGLKHLETRMLALYQKMREALTNRTQIALRCEAGKIEEALCHCFATRPRRYAVTSGTVSPSWRMPPSWCPVAGLTYD